MLLSLPLMQAKSAVAGKEKLEKTRAEDMEDLRKQTKLREEQLGTLLHETETRNSELICYPPSLPRWDRFLYGTVSF